MKTLPTILFVLCSLAGFSSCKKRADTVADRAAQAAEQAKAQTDPSAHAAIDEAQRIAAETNQPVQVRVTERVDIQPQTPPPAYAPPPPPVVVVSPPVGGIPPPPIVEIEEPRRSPGQVLDNALRKVGEGLQRAGEKIEDRAAEAQR